MPLNNHLEESLGLLTSDGKFKRLKIEEVIDMSGRAASILKLKENIILKSSLLCKENNYLIIVTDIGRILKIEINQESLPLMGKLAQGGNIIKLFPQENIINAVCANNNEEHSKKNTYNFFII